MRHCEKCLIAETDIDETLYSCDCAKQRGKYDLHRALSEIERFFNEGKSSGVCRSWVDYSNGKDNPA